jgi:hypothetical protein
MARIKRSVTWPCSCRSNVCRCVDSGGYFLDKSTLTPTHRYESLSNRCSPTAIRSPKRILYMCVRRRAVKKVAQVGVGLNVNLS